MNTTVRAADSFRRTKEMKVKMIIRADTISVSPKRDIFFDLSAISARTGCKNMASTLPTAIIRPIKELEYPLPSRKADAKLPITA